MVCTEILRVIIVSIASIIVLFFLTKLIGNKQISEINLFDYINSITIGSIAADMAIAENGKVMPPLVAMVVYALAAVLISFINNKSIKARRFITGKSITLMDNGEIYIKNLKRAHLDLGEFLTFLRTQGYFNIADVHAVYLEPNGQASILPNDNIRPVTPKDMKLNVSQSNVSVIVIMDGKMLDKNIDELHLDRKWLMSQIKVKGASSVDDVVLASIDNSNNLSVYLKTDKAPQNDNFQ